MNASACEKRIQELVVKVPSALHMIALKLHAARHGAIERRSKDMNDIRELMLLNHLDVNGAPFREVCEKFGTPELYEEIRRTASNR